MDSKKRVFADEDEDRNSETKPKRSCPSFPSGFQVESLTAADRVQLFSQIVPFINHMVFLQVKRIVQSRLPSPSQKNEAREDGGRTTLKFKFKLCFRNQISPLIVTNTEIKAENGGPLEVAICDATNPNAIVYIGPLALAQIEFFVLDGDFGGSGQTQEKIHWTLSDFNQNVLSPREGKRPLIVGDDLKPYLKNGVGFINSLSITDNSSWVKSRTFRLGAKIVDRKILAGFPRIGEAVSQPFRVMDNRGKGNKMLHPPTKEDEVWRLEGIGRNGVNHKNLSSEGIETVGDFLNAYVVKGPTSLRKLLGNKVSDKTWKTVVENALKCDHQSFEQNLMKNEAMKGEAFD